MNDTLKTIFERYSCRGYTGEVPSAEQLQAIAAAAVAAPSSLNSQPWRVIVVTNRELLAELEAEGMRIITSMEDKWLYERIMSRGGKIFYNTPCMIFVPIETARLPDASLDCGIVCQNIALAAASMELGSVICGLAGLIFMGENGGEFKKKLAFPEGFEFGGSVLVGQAAVNSAPHMRDTVKINFIR